jgi:murein DD-endopeptidase MepM/ murein hydrolase activator NlpD
VRPHALIGLLGLSALLVAGGVGAGVVAAPPDRAGGATARGYGIQVLVPGQEAQGTAPVSAPEDGVQFGGTYALPADGTIASLTSDTVSVSAQSGTVANSTASAEVTGLKLFNGEITADTIDTKATGTATQEDASGDLSQSTVTNLVVLGQPVTPTPNQRVDLLDWGYVLLLEQVGTESATDMPGYRGFVAALDIHLTADHGGLPAGSEILVGDAEVDVQAAEPPPVPTAPAEPTTTAAATTSQAAQGPKSKRKAHEPKSKSELPVHPPPSVTPELTAGGYDFPVYGPSSFVDSFGAPRGDVSGGWHHGDDIFAPLGAPLLACASGTIFSVGWNHIGGLRLWLRDDQGNEFYYAHLSAYSPLARNGAHVEAGDVIGFVGNTGDAQGTPYHLHFEVHPVALLGLGYDGAVDPTRYLTNWERLQDVPITAVGAWAPSPAPNAQAPRPGAIVLQVSDISAASGLDPASLRRAVAPISVHGEGAVPLLRSALSPPG